MIRRAFLASLLLGGGLGIGFAVGLWAQPTHVVSSFFTVSETCAREFALCAYPSRCYWLDGRPVREDAP